MVLKVTMTGDKAMKRKLEQVAGEQGMRKEARGALKAVGEPLVPKMVARTPRKTGKLQDSERLRVMVSGKKEDLRVTLIAGGPDAPYARKVHETHPTQSKFMEITVNEAAPTMAGDLAREIDLRRAAGGGA